MSTAPTAPRASLLTLAYLAFISLGLPDGLIGVGWPSISSDFHVPTAAVGLVLTSATVGYLTSSVAAGFALTRLGVGGLLAVSTALAALALGGFVASPALALMIGCALLLGLGSGAIDSGLNAYAAGAFGPRHMNWMHAFFGLGVALGPLIMTGVLKLGLSWRWGYGTVAVAQLVLASAFVLTLRAWGRRRVGGAAAPGEATPIAVRGRDTLALPAVWFGVLAFAVYTAIEVAAGLWAYLLLTTGRGMGATAAGICVSGYWASLFVGRVVQGVVAERLGTGRVLVGSLAGMAAGAVLVAVPGPAYLAVAGLAIIGFAAAPVFPLLTLTTAERVGPAHADRTIGLQIAGAGLGGALIPAGIGLLLGGDVERLGPALTVLSLLLLALYAASARRRSSAASPVAA
ncbi:MFS transporter [Micromonospora sp. NPDC049679]|uniref:MFS transporter n=1 Tax=Micromonospora sp. NPDC049679 TaxID=3155920 RepID=UPI0033EBE379